MSKGYLTVRTFLAQKILPVEGTTVIITQSGKTDNIFFSDESGLTPTAEYDAPEMEQSETPNNTSAPFYTVDITAKLDGFFTTKITGVQIFPDRTTIQNINMIPVTDYMKNSTIEINTRPQDL